MEVIRARAAPADACNAIAHGTSGVIFLELQQPSQLVGVDVAEEEKLDKFHHPLARTLASEDLQQQGGDEGAVNLDGDAGRRLGEQVAAAQDALDPLEEPSEARQTAVGSPKGGAAATSTVRSASGGGRSGQSVRPRSPDRWPASACGRRFRRGRSAAASAFRNLSSRFQLCSFSSDMSLSRWLTRGMKTVCTHGVRLNFQFVFRALCSAFLGARSMPNTTGDNVRIASLPQLPQLLDGILLVTYSCQGGA